MSAKAGQARAQPGRRAGRQQQLRPPPLPPRAAQPWRAAPVGHVALHRLGRQHLRQPLLLRARRRRRRRRRRRAAAAAAAQARGGGQAERIGRVLCREGCGRARVGRAARASTRDRRRRPEQAHGRSGAGSAHSCGKPGQSRRQPQQTRMAAPRRLSKHGTATHPRWAPGGPPPTCAAPTAAACPRPGPTGWRPASAQRVWGGGSQGGGTSGRWGSKGAGVEGWPDRLLVGSDVAGGGRKRSPTAAAWPGRTDHCCVILFKENKRVCFGCGGPREPRGAARRPLHPPARTARRGRARPADARRQTAAGRARGRSPGGSGAGAVRECRRGREAGGQQKVGVMAWGASQSTLAAARSALQRGSAAAQLASHGTARRGATAARQLQRGTAGEPAAAPGAPWGRRGRGSRRCGGSRSGPPWRTRCVGSRQRDARVHGASGK